MTVVVYVHGLWMQGREGFLLRRRLGRALAAETRSFTYSSRRATVADAARALGEYLATIRTDTLHLVAHSLGGLVVLQLFESRDSADRLRLPAGRIVLLGSLYSTPGIRSRRPVLARPQASRYSAQRSASNPRSCSAIRTAS